MKESEINGQGPIIFKEDLEKLYRKLEEIEDGDTLVLAGSIPNTLPEDLYENILKRLSHKKIRAVVDATKDLLLNVLKYRPFLIKPNSHELGEMFGVDLKRMKRLSDTRKNCGISAQETSWFPWLGKAQF